MAEAGRGMNSPVHSTDTATAAQAVGGAQVRSHDPGAALQSPSTAGGCTRSREVALVATLGDGR
eukprot:11685039-Alexandrium_andersonii.AAC.1